MKRVFTDTLSGVGGGGGVSGMKRVFTDTLSGGGGGSIGDEESVH